MTIKSGRESAGRQIGEYYSGQLYKETKSPLFRFLNVALSKVKTDEEDLAKLKDLSKRKSCCIRPEEQESAELSDTPERVDQGER